MVQPEVGYGLSGRKYILHKFLLAAYSWWLTSKEALSFTVTSRFDFGPGYFDIIPESRINIFILYFLFFFHKINGYFKTSFFIIKTG
jgi:hypothetical protein